MKRPKRQKTVRVPVGVQIANMARALEVKHKPGAAVRASMAGPWQHLKRADQKLRKF